MSVKAKEKKETDKKEPEKTEIQNAERYIYIGKTIFTNELTIQNNCVLLGINENLKILFKKYEGLEKLFIPMKDFSKIKVRKNYYLKLSEEIYNKVKGGA
ncbi:MAG: hypothetical protein ACRC51_04080 [Cetobacterium sp.]